MGAPAISNVDTGYVHVCSLSEGGMGIVELALRKEGAFRRLYAVKRLHTQFRNDERFRQMFLDEARIAGLLRHPNAVSVLDVGEDHEGPFLVMDYVEGLPLYTLIAEAPKRGRIPVQVAARIALQCARGLHAAHELVDHDGRTLELVHRDVSPQNVLVGFDGVVRLTDFGIAKALGRSTRTHTGVLKGKFGYMAPEQLQFREPDRRTDLFALGVIFYELLSGERLYHNDEGYDGVRRVLDEPPPDIADVRSDVPDALVELLFGLLAKSPDARPSDGREVAACLEEVIAELVSVEGNLELSTWIDATYPDAKRDHSQWLDASLRQADARPAPRLAVGERTESRVTTGIRVRRRNEPAGTARIWAVALSVGLLLAVGSWFLARATASPDAAAVEVVEPAPQTPPLARSDAPSPQPVDPAAPSPEEPAADPAPETEAEAELVDVEPERPAPDPEEVARRRERQRRAFERREATRRAMAMTMDSVPIVDWNSM